MVIDIVDGREVDDVTLKETTALTGFALSDLQRHCGQARRRRELCVERPKELHALEVEYATRRTAAKEAHAKLTRLVAEFNEAARPLEADRDSTAFDFRQAGVLAQELRREITAEVARARPFDWRAKLDQLGRDHAAVLQQIGPLQIERAKVEPLLKNLQMLEMRVTDSKTVDQKKRAVAALATASGARTRYDALTESVAAAQREVMATQSRIDAHCDAGSWTEIEFLTEAGDQEVRDQKRAAGMHVPNVACLLDD